MRLSTAELSRFHDQGYLVAQGFLDGDEIAHLTTCYMDTVERLRTEQSLENVQSGGDRDKDFQVFQIRTAHLQHPIFGMLIHDTRLLDMVEGLIGPDIRLVHYQGLYKPPRTGGIIGWHQDNRYFEVEGERTVSVWLALDDATVENGCMWYLPGGHDRMREHRQLWDTDQKKGFYFAIDEIDESHAEAAPVPAGGLSIHHCLMPHRSLRNETDRPRRGLAMHFMDAKAPDPGFLKRGLRPGATPLLRGRANPDTILGTGPSR
ncbi:MAG: phytanoyl-CoA dioxygenase family protein [Proteobacteria bacterium]|nr:phytanoyl-CoA dioxygenase family protein [Pseudomonadota bacterium]MDA1308382.1 phytanoyl-CoA dioxygenase family protein [Pseudomonadota bacterium]